MFSKYHYLNHSHHNAARVFVAFVDDQLAGFCSVLHFPHAQAKNLKRIHRLVILPDYQGAGIGLRLLEQVAELITKAGNKCSIVTSAPSLITAFKKSMKWRCARFGRGSKVSATTGRVGLKATTSENRITTSWVYVS